MSKVTQQAATPESWSPSLKQRTIVYDPLHAEMIGYGDEVYGDEDETADTDNTYPDVEEKENPEELVTDSDAPEEAPQEEEEPPPVEMGPDDDSAGPSEPPTFTPAADVGTTFAPAASSPAQAAQAAASSFQAKIAKGNPKALSALRKLAAKAKTSPIHKATLKVLAKPQPKKKRPVKMVQQRTAPINKKIKKGDTVKYTGPNNVSLRKNSRYKVAMITPGGTIFLTTGNGQSQGATSNQVIEIGEMSWIRGEVIGREFVGGDSGASGHIVVKILETALSPITWATHGVGTVAKVIGTELEHLAKKL